MTSRMASWRWRIVFCSRMRLGWFRCPKRCTQNRPCRMMFKYVELSPSLWGYIRRCSKTLQDPVTYLGLVIGQRILTFYILLESLTTPKPTHTCVITYKPVQSLTLARMRQPRQTIIQSPRLIIIFIIIFSPTNNTVWHNFKTVGIKQSPTIYDNSTNTPS